MNTTSKSSRAARAWGKAIQNRRERLGLSRAQMADQLGVTRQMVRLWETGTHTPSPAMQDELVDRYQLDPVVIANEIWANKAAA